jgi:5-methylcytosine-specific restriction protein A
MGLKNRDWKKWYSDPRHRRRRDHQLKVQPLCEDCLAQSRHTPATIAHHIEPHQGDINKFLTGPLRSLCERCHNKMWAVDKRGYSTAIGVDGRPLDPRHPCNVEPAREDSSQVVESVAATSSEVAPLDDLASPYCERARAPHVAPRSRGLPRHLSAMLARQRAWKPK